MNSIMTFKRLLFEVLWCFGLVYCRYEATWASLDTRPLPKWYDNVKVGIFIHWGVFSVPSVHSEWFWDDWRAHDAEVDQYMKANYPPDFSYQEFAKDFKAEFFNATAWADLFAKSGAKYVVLTSKHHEGFTLWPSKYAYSWNAKDIGPHRDIIDELGTAVRNADLKFGVYHSLYEWFNPMYLSDKATNFESREFVLNKILPEMHELVNNYQPSILWSDGDWEAPDTYWKSTDFLAWLYNDSPVKDEIVVNDRWGKDIPCHHGDFYTCSDRFDPGKLQKHKWENAMTIDRKSWGFRRNAPLADYMKVGELISLLARTVSCGVIYQVCRYYFPIFVTHLTSHSQLAIFLCGAHYLSYFIQRERAAESHVKRGFDNSNVVISTFNKRPGRPKTFGNAELPRETVNTDRY